MNHIDSINKNIAKIQKDRKIENPKIKMKVRKKTTQRSNRS